MLHISLKAEAQTLEPSQVDTETENALSVTFETNRTLADKSIQMFEDRRMLIGHTGVTFIQLFPINPQDFSAS